MRLFSILHFALTHTILVTGGLLYLHDPEGARDRLASAGEVLRTAIYDRVAPANPAADRTASLQVDRAAQKLREVATATDLPSLIPNAKFLKVPSAE
ncbi:hypothetical protein BMI91_14820 [Thioclava sediminum]|uniref:Uncharacterized protein n=1 Tax=Thioclava sediminum TaxID=1915319 RepID=A0ABX3MW06_9RHOB|nr:MULTISPECIES: hypothetical protein [Thioclava]OOY15960.1 hypothetical protein BMI85_10495 [Thioclava sp. DLFJ4-1]OOY23733.1 hypothetical protein BMI91_14820 [Thioclava sediminum]